MARRLRLNSRMGILADGSAVVPALTGEQFAGPGSARTGYSEYNQRELLARWADHLERPVAAAGLLHVGSSGAPHAVAAGGAADSPDDPPVLEHVPSEDTAEVTGA